MSRILFGYNGLMQFRDNQVQVIPSGSTADDCICCDGGSGQDCNDLICDIDPVQSITFSLNIPSTVIRWELKQDSNLNNYWARYTISLGSAFNGTYNALKVLPGSTGFTCSFDVQSDKSVSFSETRYDLISGTICPDTTTATTGASASIDLSLGAGSVFGASPRITILATPGGTTHPDAPFINYQWTWGQCQTGLRTIQSYSSASGCGANPPNDEIQNMNATLVSYNV